jgi:hypothetical protein
VSVVKYLDTSGFIDELGSVEAARPIVGFYLIWAALSDLGGEVHSEDDTALTNLRSRKVNPLDYENYDPDKLTDEDLNDEGNRFSEVYLENPYFEDYVYALLDNSSDEDKFFVENTWENYEKVAKYLDDRLKRWRSGKPLKRPWWKIWG